MDTHPTNANRRKLLAGAATLAAMPLAASQPSREQDAKAGASAKAGAARGAQPAANLTDRRKLGALEVSSLGLGVQNMHRTYQTTVPYRPEMIHIIRTAHERGVTFFDCAEAYGPFENERILGEAIAPFRDEVVITSKFGWNIDPDVRIQPLLGAGAGEPSFGRQSQPVGTATGTKLGAGALSIQAMRV